MLRQFQAVEQKGSVGSCNQRLPPDAEKRSRCPFQNQSGRCRAHAEKGLEPAQYVRGNAP